MGGVDDFSAHEALVMIGELYVQNRRAESEVERLTEQLVECHTQNQELHNEIDNLKSPEETGEETG